MYIYIYISLNYIYHYYQYILLYTIIIIIKFYIKLNKYSISTNYADQNHQNRKNVIYLRI